MTLFVTGTIFGSTVFTIVALRIWQIQPGLHTLTMALRISALPASIGPMAAGRTIPELVLWWTVFLVETIAGERLELWESVRFSLELCLEPGAPLMGGYLVSLGNLSLASRLLGTGPITPAGWLLRYSVSSCQNGNSVPSGSVIGTPFAYK